MKKSLIALAAMAATGMAFAQSSVTLFGIVDATLARGTGSLGSKNLLTNSGYNSSRLGFRGTEDLGGGMSASFWLEAALNNDNGAGGESGKGNAQGSGNYNNQASGVQTGSGLTFNRRSTVSLAGGFGELRLGRDYTPQFNNLTVFDPFGTNGVGTTQTLNSNTNLTAVRASNSIGYFLPGNLGGFYGQGMYYMGENLSNATAGGVAGAPSTKNDGNGVGVRLGWAGGPVNVAASLSKTTYATGDVKQNNIGAQWDFRVLKLLGEYSWDKLASPTATALAPATLDGKGFVIGGLVPVGAGEIRASYSQYAIDAAGPDPRAKKLALGYVHNLSKRTALYATAAHLKNENGSAQALNGASTAANASSNGYDLGIRHSF